MVAGSPNPQQQQQQQQQSNGGNQGSSGYLSTQPYIPQECQGSWQYQPTLQCQTYLGVSSIYNLCLNIKTNVMNYYSSQQTGSDLTTLLFQSMYHYCSTMTKEYDYFTQNENNSNSNPFLQNKSQTTQNNGRNPYGQQPSTITPSAYGQPSSMPPQI